MPATVLLALKLEARQIDDCPLTRIQAGLGCGLRLFHLIPYVGALVGCGRGRLGFWLGVTAGEQQNPGEAADVAVRHQQVLSQSCAWVDTIKRCLYEHL